MTGREASKSIFQNRIIYLGADGAIRQPKDRSVLTAWPWLAPIDEIRPRLSSSIFESPGDDERSA